MSDMNIFGNKVSFILLLVFVIFIYIIMFSILHKNNETPSAPIIVIEIILWLTLIIIIIVNIKWLNDKDFNVRAELNDLFDNKLTELNIFANQDDDTTRPPQTTQAPQTPTPSSSCKPDPEDAEVFHIESNTYTYDDAKDVCKLLDARLATYEEVERAYQNGANWCSYGWSD